MWGKCSVMENVLHLWGRGSTYLLILCEVYFCPMAIISLLFLSFKLPPTDGQE